MVDSFGTADISLVNTENRSGHRVLVYRCRRTPEVTSLSVYDPNRPAHQYGAEGGELTIEVDTSGRQPVVRPHGSPGYDAFVYDRYDRVVAARRSAAPLDGFDRTADDFRDLLFDVALFLVDADVRPTALGPGERLLSRTVAPFMDRRHTEYHRARVRSGARPGRYRIVVTGTKKTDYTLEPPRGESRRRAAGRP